ncbi:MAG: class I SAM-dependent methyltransferase [Pseudomonadales bacterium]|nr:class I SAM-dependent methyltransferase [Pseudomonadales bacterium]
MSKVEQLYSEKVDEYVFFVSAFFYPQGLRSFFEGSDFPGSSRRVLDAGCGTGIVTFALLKALDRQGYGLEFLHGFDLSPKMLEQFRENLEKKGVENVHLREADVLKLADLPPSWSDYDLIVSASMLEYIPKEAFAEVLGGLRSRLSKGGRLVLFMTRKNWLTKMLIERLWSANRYSKEELEEAFVAAGFVDITFRRFPLQYVWLNLWGHIVEARFE